MQAQGASDAVHFDDECDDDERVCWKVGSGPNAIYFRIRMPIDHCFGRGLSATIIRYCFTLYWGNVKRKGQLGAD